MSATLYSVLSFVLTGLFALSLGAAPVQAQQGPDPAEEIRQMLLERDQDIKRMLGTNDTFTQAQRDTLKTEINSVIDFEAMGRQALGPFWDDLAPAQRQEFVDVFSEIVRTQSLSDLDVYRSQVTYENVTVEDDSAYVETSTVYKGTPTDVDYVLGREADTWLVHDIILDEVSTAGGYARSFQTVVRKRGFEALMSSLHRKLEQVQSSS